ncbi:potassium channel subfamily T member 1 [Strongylocentrotus purpuratus]|uniref:RCK N-terminal domain-containing protein n=1 Tax=Strongylocentrotus purpuratus TaxID=7668 RepID=A0A7M7PRX8_STRPU|nr:potassium channel subfamily T member 1 [Strongylocentrotus purpuratus]
MASSDKARYSKIASYSQSPRRSEPSVRVEFFVDDKSFKERLQLYFIKNQRSSLRIRLFNFTIKLLSCLLYGIRASMDDDPRTVSCYGCDPRLRPNDTDLETCSMSSLSPAEKSVAIDWLAMLWVKRTSWLWAIQVSIAIISLAQHLLLMYLQHKGSILQQIFSVYFFLEAVNSVPFIVTIFWEPLRNLFIPIYLNCWLAKYLLENLFNDLHRVMMRSHSALSQRVMILFSFILCLIFTCACGMHHLERGDISTNGMSFFHAFYFTIVTFSTVGYGDIEVRIWPSQLYVIIMICSALVILPIQLENLAYLIMERQKQGGTYSRHRAQTEKHVVVCATNLQYDLIVDFLNEFYAHNDLQDFFVVLLSPCELDNALKALLTVPLWAQRVIYIQGSALKDGDLIRCRMDDAEACFILSPRNFMDRCEADQQTILRTWAVKDFAPDVPQYIQILKPDNRFHVQFADHVVCEDQFKYALLANNCLCPGTSTFVTLLIHTSRGVEGCDSHSQWQRTYGRCSGNEVYHIVLGNSKFFNEYEGKSFTYASFHAHKKYGVSLVGIKKQEEIAKIQLNPGPRHIMRVSDICFYMNISPEENSTFILNHPNEDNDGKENKMDKSPSNAYDSNGTGTSRIESAIASVGSMALELHHFGSTRSSNSASGTATSPSSTSSASEPKNKLEPSSGRGTSGGLRVEIPPRSSMDQAMDRNHLMPPGGGDDGGTFTTRVMDDDECAPPMPRGREGRRPSIMPVLEMMSSDPEDDQLRDDRPLQAQKQVAIETEDVSVWDEEDPWTKGTPPLIPFIGYQPGCCHLLSQPKKLCCLEIDQPCDHSSWRHAAEYNWPNNCIILAVEYAALGMVDFIVPLRAHWRPKHTLKPIVILVEKRPDTCFLESIAAFPMVYYMIGTIESLDDLLRAGILQSDTVVVVDKESSKLAEEDYMADANQIVAAQYLFKLFPHISIITELTHPSNMRFMQFRAKDSYALRMAEKQKKEKEKGSNISYMFRLPFSAGNVFSASMLDTLLYQSFVKEYMISFTRQLLGLDQAPGSGYLCELRITHEDMWIRTYGRLYQKLCSTTHEIPIGVYKTHNQSDNKSELSVTIEDDDSLSSGQSEERKEIAHLVRQKMKKMDIPPEEYDSEVSDKRNKVSYVLINPSFETKLEVDDIIFIIRPAGGPKTPSPMPPRRKFSSRRVKPKNTQPKTQFQEPTGSNVDTKL